MSVTTFGVTYTSVRDHHFPQLATFSTTSAPTSTVVSAMINESAAELEGKLLAESITASGITADSAPYYWCAQTLRLMAAIKVARALTAQNADIIKAWEAELKVRLDALAAGGGTALGDPDLSGTDVEPDGPTTHIDVYGLDIGDPEADASDVIPVLRRSDVL